MMAVYTETINMDGNLGAQAKKAADEVAVLSKGLAAAEAALVRASALGDINGFQKATANVAAYKAAIDAVPQALIAEAAAHDKAAKAAADAAKAAKVSEANKVAAAEASAAAMERAGATAVEWGKKAAAAAAVVAVAFASLVLAGVNLALSAADAKGDLILLFDVLLDGVGTGDDAIAMFDRLGAATGQTREALSKISQGFAALATSTDHLEALTLAAVSASAMAKGGGEAFEAMYKKIATAQQTGQALKVPLKGLGSLASMGLKVDDVSKRMGLSAAELAKQLEAGSVDAKKFGDALTNALIEKGADPVADAALDLGNMWARAKEAVGKFFEDIKIEPFLKEVKALFGILDQANPSGQALKAGIGAFFQKVFDLMAKGVPYVKRFFLDLIIYGLQAYLALRQVVTAIKAFAESEEGARTLEVLKNGLLALAIVVGVVIGTLGLFVAAVVATGVAIGAAVAAIAVALHAAMITMVEWASTGVQLAVNFVDGLVKGITDGSAKVIAAVKNLASQAGGAFKGALGIQSPSTVMAGYGTNMGEGVALGLDSSVGTVEQSSTGMATAAVEAVGAAPAPSMPTSSGGGGGITVTVEAGAFVIQGGGGSSAAELTEQAVAVLFERVAAQQGLGA